MVRRLDEQFLTPGREQTLRLRSGGWDKGYASEDVLFGTTPPPLQLQRLGFAVAINYGLPGGGLNIRFALALPYWFLCLLAVPFPLAWTIRWRKRRRAARRAITGLCFSCGYDLRATPDAGGATLAICPECGAAAELEAASGS